MSFTRRTFLSGGVAVSLWAARGGRPASAETEAKGPAAPIALTAEAGALTLAPAPAAPTKLLTYNGACPGPLIRARAGGRLWLRFANALDEPATLSLPGLRSDAVHLSPFGVLAPGKSGDVSFSPPDAGFNLYGSLMGQDPHHHCERGLFGPVVIDEPSPPETDLETIALLADWRLDASGALADLGDPALVRSTGRLGARVSVAGQPAPLKLKAAPGARVRLRLGNAAPDRAMMLSVASAKTWIVAVDGQPSEPFEPLRNLIPIGPGARFELMFDLPREAGAEARFILRGGELSDDEPDRDLLVFATVGAPAAARPPIAGLPPNPKLPGEIALERAERRELTIAGGGAAPLTLAGASMAKPAFVVRRATPVTLAFTNKTAFLQTMRLSGHVARILHALDDGWEPYWRNIFVIPPGKTVRAAFVADNPGKWPLESAQPERRNAGLMTWFEVT